MSTAKKSDRRSAKLTDAQQDIMFEWLEQTPAIYDTNHEHHKLRVQLFGEQAVRMGSVDGTTLQLWFKSCRTVISKCKTRKSGTIGVRANIHLGGGRPSFARMDSVGGGGGSSRNFPGSIFSGGGGSSRNYPGSIFCGVAELFPLTAVTDPQFVFFPVNSSNRH